MNDYIILAGGCFWGVEELFRKYSGVISTEVGYTGGQSLNPTYNDVKTGITGHAEAIKVTYDKSQVQLNQLLHYFFKLHDPTTLNRQGNDQGTQYRSAIFIRNNEQKEIAKQVIADVEKLGRFKKTITTSLENEAPFYTAEDFHQKYLEKNPNGYTCHYIRD